LRPRCPEAWGLSLLGLACLHVDFTWPLDPSLVLAFSALAAAAIRVSALNVRAARRASCVALRWLARRLISLALFLLSMGGLATYSRRWAMDPNPWVYPRHPTPPHSAQSLRSERGVSRRLTGVRCLEALSDRLPNNDDRKQKCGAKSCSVSCSVRWSRCGGEWPLTATSLTWAFNTCTARMDELLHFWLRQKIWAAVMPYFLLCLWEQWQRVSGSFATCSHLFACNWGMAPRLWAQVTLKYATH
jgi:hypothetical protein